MLFVMDKVMTAASHLTFGLIFDAATAHQMLKRLLLGVPSAEDRRAVEDPSMELTFFNKLEFRDLPEHGLPRLPMRRVFVDGKPYTPLPGPCSLPTNRKRNIFLSIKGKQHQRAVVVQATPRRTRAANWRRRSGLSIWAGTGWISPGRCCEASQRRPTLGGTVKAIYSTPRRKTLGTTSHAMMAR